MGNFCSDCFTQTQSSLATPNPSPITTQRPFSKQMKGDIPTSFCEQNLMKKSQKSNKQNNPEEVHSNRNSLPLAINQAEMCKVRSSSSLLSSSSQLKRSQFKMSKEYQSYENGERDINNLLELGEKAFDVGLFHQSKNIYERALNETERSTRINQQTKDELRLYFYKQLLRVLSEIGQTSCQKYFLQCLKLYQKMPEYKQVQEKITILNNFAVYYKRLEKYPQAIQLCQEALKLEEKYFSFYDERTFITLINLACLYYQNGQKKDGNGISQRIQRTCPSELSYLRQLAKENRQAFESRISSRQSSKLNFRQGSGIR